MSILGRILSIGYLDEDKIVEIHNNWSKVDFEWILFDKITIPDPQYNLANFIIKCMFNSIIEYYSSVDGFDYCLVDYFIDSIDSHLYYNEEEIYNEKDFLTAIRKANR